MKTNEMDEQLKEALDRLERLTQRETPPAAWFNSFVYDQQAEQRRKFRRDLLLFLAIAPFAVLLTMGTLAYGVVAMLVFQPLVLALISLPVVLRMRRRKKVDG